MSLWFYSSVLFYVLTVVSAVPFQIVDSGKPKCVIVEMPGDTVARIHYDAPDLALDDTSSKISGPTYITVMERPMPKVSEMIKEEEGESDDEVLARKRRMEQEKRKNPPKSTELKQHKGILDHHVHQDSEVNICIRASAAGSKNPMRFGLYVEEVSEEDLSSVEDAESHTADVDKHLSHMEWQLHHIEHLMHAMIKNADLAKDIDAVHHRHTDAMYKATAFWPFVHVGILLVTGFTQVNHIVRFFKSRRII